LNSPSPYFSEYRRHSVVRRKLTRLQAPTVRAARAEFPGAARVHGE